MTEGLVFVRRSAPEARVGDHHWIELEDDTDVGVGQLYRNVATGETMEVVKVQNEKARASRHHRAKACFARCRGTRATEGPIQAGTKLVYVGRAQVGGEAA